MRERDVRQNPGVSVTIILGSSDDARKTVAEGVVSCTNDLDQLAKHGKCCYDYYICVCKLLIDIHSNSHFIVEKIKGRSPASSFPARLKLELKSKILLKESPMSHEAAKHHVSALIISFIRKLTTLLPFPFLRPWSGTDTVALSRETMDCLRQNTIRRVR